MIFTPLDARHLEALGTLLEPGSLSTGESNLDLHACDQSHHLRCRPEAVVWPNRAEEVSKILRYAHEHQIPVTGWGSGSSLEGNPIPVSKGIVIDFSRMNRILNIRAQDFQADVEPGVIYQDLNEKLRYSGIFFPPDPGARATLGGMIANNASGTRTVRYGSTKDYVLRLRIALAGGEIIEVGNRASKSSSGYDLLHLFIGSEGTLGLVVEATIRLVGIPAERSAVVATFDSAASAGKTVFEIMRGGLDPAALELLSPECIRLINREKSLALKERPTLFMEFSGPSKNQLAEILEIVRSIADETHCQEFRSGLGKEEWDTLFKARHELGEMIIRNHPGRGFLTTDVAVPISTFPEVLDFAAAASQTLTLPFYIFGHAGDGNIHMAMMGKHGDAVDWDAIAAVNRRLVLKAISVGGTATGEHGVGIGKRQFMEMEHGASLAWMKRVKDLFDPNGILNPGKIFPVT
ncbi:(S)-2-hydroxy-acid oxidase chain D [uncultured Desulfatiglans sp.]|uniref:D-lactate dehydrogenase (cytochrome) n=1 Tax=Uncultured Desulfatiglans sp. TaxID=1748965 RepID=A0A653A2M3_UNCDX|nr:(S)-2-hydroxy-acid oxidase chain D [uncultured Desulfatiglans sp.]